MSLPSEGVRGPINSVEIRGSAGEYGDEVGFERANGSFRCVASMSVGGN